VPGLVLWSVVPTPGRNLNDHGRPFLEDLLHWICAHSCGRLLYGWFPQANIIYYLYYRFACSVQKYTAEISCIRIYLKLSGYPEVDFDTFYPPYVAAAIIIDEKLFSRLSVNGNTAIPKTLNRGFPCPCQGISKNDRFLRCGVYRL